MPMASEMRKDTGRKPDGEGRVTDDRRGAEYPRLLSLVIRPSSSGIRNYDGKQL